MSDADSEAATSAEPDVDGAEPPQSEAETISREDILHIFGEYLTKTCDYFRHSLKITIEDKSERNTALRSLNSWSGANTQRQAFQTRWRKLQSEDEPRSARYAANLGQIRTSYTKCWSVIKRHGLSQSRTHCLLHRKAETGLLLLGMPIVNQERDFPALIETIGELLEILKHNHPEATAKLAERLDAQSVRVPAADGLPAPTAASCLSSTDGCGPEDHDTMPQGLVTVAAPPTDSNEQPSGSSSTNKYINRWGELKRSAQGDQEGGLSPASSSSKRARSGQRSSTPDSSVSR